MKKILFTICTLLCANVLLAQGYFSINPLTYRVTSENEVSVVACDENNTIIEIPEMVTNNGQTYSVTSIGNDAFYGITTISRITLPNTITNIGASAFRQCTGLDSINIPNGVVTIGTSAFDGCLGLDSIVIPNSVVEIGDNAFYQCSGLSSVRFEENSSLSSIAQGLFDRCTALGTIVIPKSVAFVERSAFSECSNLHHVYFEEGSNALFIGAGAFTRCTALRVVVIPESIMSVGTNAFARCEALDSVVCLAEVAPMLGSNAFYYTPDDKVLTVLMGTDYTSWRTTTPWRKTYYLIRREERRFLNDLFLVNDTTGLINHGVLRINYGGELVNEFTDDEEPLSGIFEVSTDTLYNDRWHFIGAPLNSYKLESVVPGSRDISVSMFNYSTGAWSEEWATVDTAVGQGEGFFTWSFANEPTIFTTYGDGADAYDFDLSPAYALNNDNAILVYKRLTTNPNGGNWMALANPYTFKLDISSFVGHNNAQGGVIYRFNGTNWEALSQGVLNVTEGFFVNFSSTGNKFVTFNKTDRYVANANAKSMPKSNLIKITMIDGDNEIDLFLAHNEKAEQSYDIFDANKMFSPIEVTEPYFVTDGMALVKEEVKKLPYYASLNVKSFEDKEVKFRVNNIPEGYTLRIIDGDQVTLMNNGDIYSTEIVAGENADRFKVLLRKTIRLEEENYHEIDIINNNRLVNIDTKEENLYVRVYNILGETVYETRSLNFSLNDVPAGIYMVKAFNRTATKTTKIVVE